LTISSPSTVTDSAEAASVAPKLSQNLFVFNTFSDLRTILMAAKSEMAKKKCEVHPSNETTKLKTGYHWLLFAGQQQNYETSYD
jgi:hypothetical protein